MKCGDMVLCEDGVERRYICTSDSGIGYAYVECDKTVPDWFFIAEEDADHLRAELGITFELGTMLARMKVTEIKPTGATCIRCNEFAPYQPTDSNFACWQCREHHAWEVAIIRSKK